MEALHYEKLSQWPPRRLLLFQTVSQSLNLLDFWNFLSSLTGKSRRTTTRLQLHRGVCEGWVDLRCLSLLIPRSSANQRPMYSSNDLKHLDCHLTLGTPSVPSNLKQHGYRWSRCRVQDAVYGAVNHEEEQFLNEMETKARIMRLTDRSFQAMQARVPAYSRSVQRSPISLLYRC